MSLYLGSGEGCAEGCGELVLEEVLVNLKIFRYGNDCKERLFG